ncbi:MAG: DUF5657 family protein [Candidatus Dojkabacteria bacterium]
MNNAKTFLDNLDGKQTELFSVSLMNILKIPLFLFLVGNILFSLLLFLRVRILVDTFKAPQNKTIQTITLAYVAITIIGSLLSALFLILS